MPKRRNNENTEKKQTTLPSPASTPSSASSDNGQTESGGRTSDADVNATSNANVTNVQHRPRARNGTFRATKPLERLPKTTTSKNAASANAPYEVQRTRLQAVSTANTKANGSKSGQSVSMVDEAFRQLRESMTSDQRSAPEQASQYVFAAPHTQSIEPALEFVSWNHPSHPESENVRRLIRAHVGRTSHPANSKTTAVSKITKAGPQTKAQHQRSSTHAASRTVKHGDDPLKAVVRSRSAQLRGFDLPYLRIRLQRCGIAENFIESATQALTNLVLRDESRQIGLALQRLGCDFNLAMRHFHFLVHAQMPSFESQLGTIGEERRSRFVPFLLSEPALIQMILLVSVTHKLATSGMNTHCAEVMHLKGFALSAMNAAMQNPALATSDQLIFAVSNFAGYEIMFGSLEGYHLHMNGLTRMVAMRGGLGSLGFDGSLERILLYHDTNFSSLARREPYLTPYMSSQMKAVKLKADREAISAGIMKSEPSTPS